MSSEFWLENPKNLYKNFKLVPTSFMTLEENLNCLTRLVIIIFIILYLLNYNYSIVFLLVLLLIIIIFYYNKRKQMTTVEAYNHKDYLEYVKQSEQRKIQSLNFSKNQLNTNQYSGSFYSAQNQDLQILEPNQLFQSANQKLVGSANPKTRIAPVSVPPIYEWTYWKQNDFQIPQNLNTRTAQDFYQSGYYVNDNENFKPKTDASENIYSGGIIKEDFVGNEYYNQNQESYYGYQQPSKDTGLVDKNPYYNPENLEYDLPTNYYPFEGQESEEMKDLNEQLFTSTINPGIYYKNNIIEPINYMEGISFDQQIPPRDLKKIKGKNGEKNYKLYTAIDPTIQSLEPEPIAKNPYISTADVYDPRSNGYGQNSRQYIETLTGQPRFFYDDVDAIRQPNYLNRSKIDFIESVDTYGPMKPGPEIYENNKNSRQTAEMTFRDNTLNHREEMMTRLMRKRNAELWQTRLAPKSRASGNYSLGGL